MVRKPLQQPYEGPFRVIKAEEKFFKLDINGKKVNVAINRLKPAFLLANDSQTSMTNHEKNKDEFSQESLPQKSITTRYGRKVRFVLPPIN